MQDTIIIRPRLHGRFADDNLFEEILCILQGSKFCLHFDRITHVQSGLNNDFFGLFDSNSSPPLT